MHGLREHWTGLGATLGAALIACALSATPVSAQSNVALDNVMIAGVKSDAKLKRVEFTGTNLTQDEVAKLFSPATSKQDAGALLDRLEAKQISIPEILVMPKDNKGKATVRELLAADVNRGKASRLSFAGVEGEGAADKGTVAFKTGALNVEEVDLAAALAALKTGDPFTGVVKVGRVSWSNLEISGPDKDTPADAAGGNLVKIRIGSIGLTQGYDGDAPTRSAMSLDGVGIELPKASPAAAMLAAQGYDKLGGSLKFSGLYDPARRTYALDDFTIDIANVASVGLRGQFGNIDKTAFAGSKEQREAAMLAGDLGSLDLRVVNAGVFEKIVAYFAQQQGKTPGALIGEWKMAATMLAPAIAQGNPIGAKAGDAAARFLTNPKSLTISAKAKGGAVKFAELAATSDPLALTQKLDIEFVTDGGAAPAPRANVAQAPAAAAPAVDKLRGMAAWNAIVGSTVSGKNSDGDPLFEFYLPDGKLKQLDDDTVTAGKWALRGQKICVLYSGEKEESCYEIEVFGDVATFTDEDGDGQRYKILKGNPKGL